MTVYSHSRVSCFEICPYKYKLQYIDRIKVDFPNTIELLLGDLVHRTLEKLYKDKKFQKINSKEEILQYFQDLWDKEYSDDIVIVKEGLTGDNYKKMGIKFISDYYDRLKPFEDLTKELLEEVHNNIELRKKYPSLPKIEYLQNFN